MNIKATLEQSQSKANVLKIIEYIGDDVTRFKELITLFLGTDSLLIQRAAWPLSYVVIQNPKLIKPYFGKFVKILNKEGNHAAVNRNLLKIMEEVEIPQKYQSQLFDTCIKIITNPANAIACIAFAITVATKICKPYKELSNEFIIVLKHLQSYEQAPAISVRIKKAYKTLKANL
ncbi:MAG: hypothetical protein SFY56_06885 [Bacteroidota bacterium]|nr:hypothetical protein [Bacteroidota bacterium]